MVDASIHRIKRTKSGFTLIELMTVVAIIGILASIALANYYSAKERAIDATMQSDLRGAMVFIEDYRIESGALPPDLATFETATNYKLSPGVQWDTFQLGLTNGVESVDLQVAHPGSKKMWHADYPANGNKIERR